MALRSMTGFARAEREIGAFRAGLEIKSVNGRGLDVRARVPAALDGFDTALRKRLGERIARGSISITLTLAPADEARAVSVDAERLERLLAIARELDGRPGVAPARIDGLLALPGIIETGLAAFDDDTERAALEAELLAAFDAVADSLIAAREREGEALYAHLRSQVEAVSALVDRAERCRGAQIDAIRSRLAERIGDLVDTARIDRDRLEHEVALLAVKLDVREEIDRLRAHVAEAIALLDAGSPVGRKLDFLAQELNREANTLCSKSADTELTRIGLELKAAIDQFREQCQNVE